MGRTSEQGQKAGGPESDKTEGRTGCGPPPPHVPSDADASHILALGEARLGGVGVTVAWEYSEG